MTFLTPISAQEELQLICAERLLPLSWAVVFYGLAICAPCLGQEISPERVREEDLQALYNQGIAVGMDDILISESRLASYLLENWEIVADGEFQRFPVEDQLELTALAREKVIVEFRINTLYKGVVSDPIEVEVLSDMLVFPGEDISRYMKRLEIRRRQAVDIEPLLRQIRALHQAFEDGTIDEREYEAKRDGLEEMVRQRRREDGLAVVGEGWAIIDASTFYDLNGAIRPNQKYLIGLKANPLGKDVYLLHEHPDWPNIYWGDMRDYILPALDERAR